MLPQVSQIHFQTEMTEESVEVLDNLQGNVSVDLASELDILSQDNMSLMDSTPLTTILTENSQSGGFNVSQMELPISSSGTNENIESGWGSLSSTLQDCSVMDRTGSPDLLLALVQDTLGSHSTPTPVPNNDTFMYSPMESPECDPWGYKSVNQGMKLLLKEETPFNLDSEDLCLPTENINVKQEKNSPCDNGYMYNCSDCDSKFSSPKSFRGHLKAHLLRIQNSCALCDIELPTKKCLQEHIRQHFLQSYAAKCPVCHKDFSSKHLLRRHTQLCHPVVQSRSPLKCDTCDAVFSSKFGLKSHQATHNSLKPFSCSECGATFTQNGSLQVHMRRHRGEKPFQCDLCGNHFTRAYSLKVHMKTHTGEKPYRCEYCGTCFVTSSHLTVHHRTHTGERPYSCQECGSTFITSSHLNVHKRHHVNTCYAPL